MVPLLPLLLLVCVLVPYVRLRTVGQGPRQRQLREAVQRGLGLQLGQAGSRRLLRHRLCWVCWQPDWSKPGGSSQGAGNQDRWAGWYPGTLHSLVGIRGQVVQLLRQAHLGQLHCRL